jgi:hypothetical protein
MPDLTESENLMITLSKDGYIPLQTETEVPAGSVSLDYLPLVGASTMIAVVLVVVVWFKFKKS